MDEVPTHPTEDAASGSRQVDVLVAGAGLAGLTAAVTAARHGRRVALLDVRSAGGRATSQGRDGFVFNQGPRALYHRGAGSAVLHRLGLHPEGAAPHPVVTGSYRGRVGRLPSSARSLVASPLLTPRSKVKLGGLLARFPRIDTAALAPLSTAAWVRSLRLPDDGAAVLSTLLRVASYAPDLEVVSADAVVRQLQLVVVGGVSYLHGGWSTIVDGLLEAAASAGVRVVAGTRVEGLACDPGSGTWEVATPGGRWRSAAVVVATGGPAAARALVPAALDWRLGPDATAACLDLGLGHPPAVPLLFDLDEPLYLSLHAPAARLAPPGAALVHVMRYGARSSEEDRDRLWRFAAQAGITSEDVVVERFLHRMVVSHALPAPGPGLPGRPPHRVPGHRGLFVAGDWVGPVGMLADASLASGEAAGNDAAALAGVAGRAAPVVDERVAR